jgi:hypothetical protein
MIELIRSLIECMAQETLRYRRLAVLAEQQKELLIAGKIEALNENVRLEEKEVFALGPLKARRGDLLKEMAKLNGLKTLSLMEALKRSPTEIIEEFKKTAIDLVQAAKKLDEVNKINGKLLNNGLSYVGFTLKVIANGGKRIFKPLVSLGEKKSSLVNRVV